MNIDALLSPCDSPAADDGSLPPSAAPSPQRTRPAPASRSVSGLSQGVKVGSPGSAVSTASTQPASSYDSSITRASQTTHNSRRLATGASTDHHSRQSPPTSNPLPPVSGVSGRHGYVQVAQRPAMTRPTSTPHMETLADLASMRQRQQPPRTYSADSVHTTVPLHSPTSASSSSSSAAVHSGPLRHPSVIRLSSTQPSVDFIMAEASSQTPEPRSVESSFLSQTESKEISELLSFLAENSYAYDSHVRLLHLLHCGFLAYANDSNTRDPRTYSLLSELRQARDAMDTRFAVGEDLWTDWLSDEIILAKSSEDRIRVTELCQKAVQDEPSSVKLWQIYTGWVSSNYDACHNVEGADQSKWTREDKEVCQELFTGGMVLNVYEQAAVATQWRIDNSHLIWNRYAEWLLQSISAPSQKDIERLRDIFMQRLVMPHVGWDDTKQIFWGMISKFDGGNWESTMDRVNESAALGQKQMSLRETHEFNLRKHVDAGDRDAELHEFTHYMQWEKRQANKTSGKPAGVLSVPLRCALFERALLRFPSAHDWWLDYVDFLIEATPSGPILPLIERATRHCPWSGDLWGRRILRSDVEGKPREEIEATKHRATNSGLLDVGGMEELLKVLQQWCSYLRRYAFRGAGAEDDRDVAELGITAALDDIEQAGLKLYGKEFKGDPLYRLEKIQIKFLVEARRMEDGREIYRRLVPLQKDSAEFWQTYYQWELWLWGYARLTERHRVETAANGPHIATAVVQEALSQRNLDWPERILDMYLNHFQQHESADKLQSAIVDAREFSRNLAIRRAKEAEEAALTAAQAVPTEAPTAGSDEYNTLSAVEKRKREDDSMTNGNSIKRPRTEDSFGPDITMGEPSPSNLTQTKRDREHNTISLTNLIYDVTELDLKKFFRDVGVPQSIQIMSDRASQTATATVEFQSYDDVLAAKTRHGKQLRGNEVHIQCVTQSTLYVANYPPEYDEVAMRRLFDGYGEVISVRFPSLKYNNRRRFCYVQFLTSDMAKAAEEALNDKMLDGQHRLLAKISDPDAKKQRSGAQAEGRELCVKNIDREASDDEIKAFFEQYGNVVSMNAVKLVSGKRTGTAFIVFSSSDDANAALAADNKPFRDRILHVEIASSKARPTPQDRARKEDVVVKQTTPASPEPDITNGRRSSDASSAALGGYIGENSWKTARERKVALFNLPDTVNDARIRATLEPYGSLVKIQMRRADAGAIVEFAQVQDAFNVRQGVDCSALGPQVRSGDVSGLLSQTKKRQASTGVGVSIGETGTGMAALAPSTIARPAQRGGVPRRGGLGFRRGAAGGANDVLRWNGDSETHASNLNGIGSTSPAKAKSNAEFRSLFEKSRMHADDAEGRQPDDPNGGES